MRLNDVFMGMTMTTRPKPLQPTNYSEPPRAVRPVGQDHQFQTPSSNPLVEPDRVGPVVEGYFHLPPVWIGSAPPDGDVSTLNPAVHHANMFEKTLNCGIKVRVNRDGLFLFDFTSSEYCQPVVLPGYIKPEGRSYRYTVEHDAADRRAEEVAVERAQIMNVHQACLVTAERLMNQGGASPTPITAWGGHKAITLSTPPAYHNDLESLHALAHKVANNVYRSNIIRSRRVLSIDLLDRSFDIFDGIISNGGMGHVKIVEAAFVATTRRKEKRYGEAITIGWTVCEQIISIKWREMINEIRENNPQRMPKERREKLIGRDYSASVMAEMLEVKGLISNELFRMLEIARKARNKWAHEMREPRGSEVWTCLRAIELLMETVLKIPLRMDGGGRGGVPQWPVWFWPDFKP